ncbi:hypothetical protein [Streptomyces sp. NPDC016845]|uniref:hypothetical protein n=1 Tax=Streptomyces sp. NPDC016845 TaxID=3364972 RepID=UPI0037B5CE33
MVRKTAAGAIVPIQFRAGATVHRCWVTSTDRDRLNDLDSDDTRVPPEREAAPATGASRNRPTCQPSPAPAAITASTPTARPALSALPVQPKAPASETDPTVRDRPRTRQTPDGAAGLPEQLITLQQAADNAHLQLQQLHDHHDRQVQRQVWWDAAATVQEAVTLYARTKRLNRYEVEARLRQFVRPTAQ